MLTFQNQTDKQRTVQPVAQAKQKILTSALCDCDTGETYIQCCGRYHQGIAAPSPLALMRSRYSAYVRQLANYLIDTWHPDTRPALVEFDRKLKWLGLDIVSAEFDRVQFVARFRVGGGRAEKLSEHSRFVQMDGRWFYLDGDVDGSTN
jgi:SEC-C motif domain protein